MARKLLFLVILVVLLGSYVQQKTGIIRSKGLDGFVPPDTLPEFSMKTWMDGSFQQSWSIYKNRHASFRPDLVRLYNQIDYSLFGISHANKIISGKDGYLLAENYINAYLGTDFAGKRPIDILVNQLKFVQDKLEKEKNIHVMVLFVPSKGLFYEDKIPGRFLHNRKPLTNYEYYIRRCSEEGINFIDFNAWFLKIKDSSRYVLYPKTGIHWSTYGSVLAADSLRHYLKARFGMNMPELVYDSIVLSKKARNDDDDIGRTMNLIWPVKYPPMAYPYYHFKADTTRPKPSALFIGDSFYWQWYYPGIISGLFRNADFWYYNKDVYPQTFTIPESTGKLDYKASFLSHDLIVLIQTNAGYGNIGYGFIQESYSYLTNQKK